MADCHMTDGGSLEYRGVVKMGRNGPGRSNFVDKILRFEARLAGALCKL